MNQTNLTRRGRHLFGAPFDLLFDNFARTFDRPPLGRGSFRVDLTETDGDYRFAAELPGVEEQDIDVSLEDGVLTIRAERRGEEPGEQPVEAGGRRYVERTFGSFRRRFSLPAEVDADAIEATLRKGVLDVRLPKAQSAQPRKISVVTAD